MNNLSSIGMAAVALAGDSLEIKAVNGSHAVDVPPISYVLYKLEL